MSNTTNDFPQALARALADAGIKKKDLAEKLGMDPTQLYRYTAGSREPRLDQIQRIGEALGGVFAVGVGGVRFLQTEQANEIADSYQEFFSFMSFTAADMERAYDDGYSTEGEVTFDIENYR